MVDRLLMLTFEGRPHKGSVTGFTFKSMLLTTMSSLVKFLLQPALSDMISLGE